MKTAGSTFCLVVLLSWAGSETYSFAQLTQTESQLSRFFEDPAYHRAIWAVKFQSVQSGEVLYQKNPDKLVMPASNMKLLTAVAAIEKLGLDFKYETLVVTDGILQGGILNGNLIVIGSGDPTLGGRLSSPNPQVLEEGDPLAIFKDWAKKLKALGIQRIDGDVIGDDSVFDPVPLGSGWSWDDLPSGYSAQIGGLQFNENNVLVKVVPGSSPGKTTSVETYPKTSYGTLTNELMTSEKYEDLEYHVQRQAGSNHTVLKGNVPAGESPFWLTVSVDNPTLFFVTVLKETLETEGIEIHGRPQDLETLPAQEMVTRQTLLVHHSPDLSYILQVLLKVSQNLYAETLIRTLDAREKSKSYDKGREEVEELLTGIGIPTDSYVLADGSGLSRYSFLTADTLVRLLRYVYHRPYRDRFMGFLPIAGVDGTLEERMKGTTAQENVHAKTGALRNVRSLSGYVTTRGGDVVAFAMIANNFTQPRRSAEYLQDLALEYLAGLSR